MKFILKNIGLTLCASIFILACATTKNAPMPAARMDPLLETMPADTAKDRDAMAKKFLNSGEATIAALFQKVVSTGEGDDTAVRTSLNGIAKYASRPGAEKQRQTFENGALAALPTLTSDEAKAFTIRQLEIAGSDASVETLSKFLNHETLAQPAITVLQLIATPEAKTALDRALGRTDNAKTNAAIIKALGDLRNSASVQKIAPYAASSDRDLRFAALYALANIANTSSEAALKSAVQSSRGYDRIEAKSLLALYQRRRAE